MRIISQNAFRRHVLEQMWGRYIKIRRKIMERETLCRLLPKDKAPALPERAKCAGFISENGDFEHRLVLQEKPLNAVVYLCVRQSLDVEMLLESEKQRGLRYCSMQGYRPLVLLESIGGDFFMEGKAMEMLLELAELRLVDVIVLSHVNNLFQLLDHASGSLEGIYRHDVMVDCVGCGILERGVFESYQRKSWRQERAFRVKLMGLALSWKMKEQGNYSAQDSAFTALSVRKQISCNGNSDCCRQFLWDCGVSAKVLSRSEQAGDDLC